MDERLKKVKSRMERLCVRREYCREDILKKIVAALGEDVSGAQEILDSLVEEKYVDDARYCEAFAREKSSIGGWGPVKIRYALRMKHIDEQSIKDGLAGIDSCAARGRMERLLAAKWKTLREDPQGKYKLIRFALGRGYSYEEIAQTVNSVCEASDR